MNAKTNAKPKKTGMQLTGAFQDLRPVKLPKPEKDGGQSVLRALHRRKTTREISDKKLSAQMLSNMLWTACGVNRKKGPFSLVP